MNVFAVLSGDLETHALDVSKQLYEQENLKAFPILGFQVHITLYMTSYETEKIGKIKDILACVAEGICSFNIKTNGLLCTREGWLFINLEKNCNLQTLADLLTNELSPYRSATIPAPSWLASYPEKSEYFKKYGSPNVLDQFEPHLTLLANSDRTKIQHFIDANKDNGSISGIHEGKVIGIGLGLADSAGQINGMNTQFLFAR